MSGKKVLILDSTGIDWTDRHLKNENTDVTAIYKKVFFPLGLIRRGFFEFNLPFKSVWYNDWKYYLNQYKMIIIFSAILGNELFSWIRRSGYKGRLIFYYRDFVNAEYIRTFAKPESILKTESSVELWSFDPQDSKRYGMKYNPQFYFRIPDSSNEVKYDIVFVGSTNGRLEQILRWKHIFENENFNVYFHIKKHKYEKIPKKYEIEVTDTLLTYEKIIDLDKASKAIFEINQTGQTGLTNRALEATFLKKKLLTTNADIKYTRLYNPHNIYILGEKQQVSIQEFLNSEYDMTDYDNITRYYDSKSWLARFLNNVGVECSCK